jgi:hypothetical protein
MTYNTRLTCGCWVESSEEGIDAVWDDYDRECNPALAYGIICEQHLKLYKARRIEYGTETSGNSSTI